LKKNQSEELEKNAVALLGNVKFVDKTLDKHFLSAQFILALLKFVTLKLEDKLSFLRTLEILPYPNKSWFIEAIFKLGTLRTFLSMLKNC
jgi:hypothetical protein